MKAGPSTTAGWLRSIAAVVLTTFLWMVATAASPDPGSGQAPNIIAALEESAMQALTEGRFGDAAEQMEEALQLAGEVGKGTGRQHGLLGVVLQAAGRFDEALGHYTGASQEYRNAGVTAGELSAELNAGTVEAEWLGLYGDAVRRFESIIRRVDEVPAVAPEVGGYALMNLAEAYAETGRLDAARTAIDQALELFESLGRDAETAFAEVVRSRILLETGFAAEAAAAARRALELSEASGDIRMSRPAWLRLGEALEALGDEQGAWHAYQEAIATLEQVRRAIGLEELQVSFLRTRMVTFETVLRFLHTMQQLHPHEGWSSRALEVVESSRHRSYLDNLPSGNSTASAAPLNAMAMQAMLDEGTVLLEYFFGQDHLYGFAVTRKNAVFRDLGPTGQHADRLALVAGAWADSSRASLQELRSLWTPTLERLGEELIYDLLEAVDAGDVTSMILVPDGPLQRFPMELILGRTDIATAYVPSASVLAEIRTGRLSRSESTAGILALAVSRSGRFPDGAARAPHLPYAVREAQEAATLFSEAVLLGRDQPATEPALRAALLNDHYSVLHFATHATIDPGDSSRNGLLLELVSDSGQGNAINDDGLLTAREIAQLHLPVDLVILSGCSTGRGEIAPGEGVMGLGRAFLRAGAKVLLVTLWPVEDRAAARIVKTFYQELAQGGSCREALQTARMNHADLADVAAFILIGDAAVTVPKVRRSHRYLPVGLMVAGMFVALFTGLLHLRRRATSTTA